MKKSIYDKLGGKTSGIAARPDLPATLDQRAPKTAPAMFLNASLRMDAAEMKAEALEEELKKVKESQLAMDLVIADLVEAPGRRRLLTQEQFIELRENLRQNPLASAITVRRLADGRHEILSGHNRVAAYRDLGRETILSVILDADDEQADLSAFYANLLQPNLPDFEKFLGFKMIQELHPEKTKEKIADESGISRSQVNRILSFGDLPIEAINLLKNNQDAIGANAADEFVKSAAKGHQAEVIEAIKNVIAKEMTQEQAIRFAKAGNTASKPASKPTEKPEPIVVRSGRNQYCSIYPTGSPKVFRLDFADPEEARDVIDAIKQLLSDMAEKSKSKQN